MIRVDTCIGKVTGERRFEMNRRMVLLRAALTVLVPLGLALPASAQSLPKDQVPFKASFKGKFQALLTVEAPPISGSLHETATGQATPLGEFKWAAHLRVYGGVDGTDAFLIGEAGSFIAANGDAITVTYVVLPRDLSNPEIGVYEGAWVVTGGRGRYAGATGSGTVRFEVKFAPGEVSTTWTGSVSAPKP
jgi:hypothetical protein